MTAAQIRADIMLTIRLWRKLGLCPEQIATQLGWRAWVLGVSWKQIADGMLEIAMKMARVQ